MATLLQGGVERKFVVVTMAFVTSIAKNSPYMATAMFIGLGSYKKLVWKPERERRL